MCMCVSECMHMNTCVGAYRDQKRALDHLELELQEVVSHLTWC